MELLNPLSDLNYPSKSASYNGTATATGTWASGPEGVMIWSDQPCYVKVGEGAIATTSSTPIPAYTPISFKVPQGSGAPWRVSAIQIVGNGVVYAKPINSQ